MSFPLPIPFEPTYKLDGNLSAVHFPNDGAIPSVILTKLRHARRSDGHRLQIVLAAGQLRIHFFQLSRYLQQLFLLRNELNVDLRRIFHPRDHHIGHLPESGRR